MKPFHNIAIPHKDILEGKLRMDIFAADLWEAYHNQGEEEYRDKDTFFRKTYMTEGLKNLLEIIKKRVDGNGGDPVIQIQTPFGGGKTHALIAIMHSTKDWKVNCCVLVGTNLSADDTLWSILEKQLTGKNEILTGYTAPGKEKIKKILEKNKPTVILIDEILEYAVKAAGKKVGDSNLAAQTLAFMQELTESVSSLEKCILVITLPSSSKLEHFDENANQLLVQLQKVCGRIEKIYTPVNENEIAKVIRQRLFSHVNEKEAKKIVEEFVDYARIENILPTGIEASEYRDKFIDSYPFLPEVIDVLYHRWGSFPEFQRTRGVLRILALLVNHHKNNNIPYLSLADFDLSNQEIRLELLKHIGNEYNSIISQDITDKESGSKKVDKDLGESNIGLKLGTRTSTSIFMYSFSTGTEKGANLNEIKRTSTIINNPSSVVAEAVEKLKSKLFYIQYQNDKYFFSNTPNLNRLILNKIENIDERILFEKEKELIRKNISNDKFKVYTWEEDPSNITDNDNLKLVILKEENENIIKQIIKSKGTSPRVYCNTVLFLCPVLNEHNTFINELKNYIAREELLNDKKTNLKEEQKNELRESINKIKRDIEYYLYRAYQIVLIPTKDSYAKDFLGVPTYGDVKKLDQRVYEHLKNNKILETLSMNVILQKYLENKEYISILNLLQTFYQTPGEMILSSKEVLKRAIMEGIEKGIFGYGKLPDFKSNYKINEKVMINFTEDEVIISPEICKNLENEKKNEEKIIINQEPEIAKEKTTSYDTSTIKTSNGHINTSKNSTVFKKNIELSIKLPQGKASDIYRIVYTLQTYFNDIEIRIRASNGEMNQQDYTNKVIETLLQLNAEYKEGDDI